jgi:hypothetical protein
MRRAGLVVALLACGLAAALPAAAGTRAPASVRVVECEPGDAGGTRTGAFRATMRRITGTRTMQLRFHLLARGGDGRYRRVKAPGLGVWRTSRPGVRKFVYTQRIAGLAARTAYRVVVHFRWLDDRGRELRFARRRSYTCEVGGALPNLRVVKVARRDGRYAVVVKNEGAGAARGFEIVPSIDGIALPAIPVRALAGYEARTIPFAGPVCAEVLSVAVDPADKVREASEADNVLVRSCRRR